MHEDLTNWEIQHSRRTLLKRAAMSALAAIPVAGAALAKAPSSRAYVYCSQTYVACIGCNYGTHCTFSCAYGFFDVMTNDMCSYQCGYETWCPCTFRC